MKSVKVAIITLAFISSSVYANGQNYVANMSKSVAGLVGFVHLPAFVAISVASFITAKLGAKIAHKQQARSKKPLLVCSLWWVVSSFIKVWFKRVIDIHGNPFDIKVTLNGYLSPYLIIKVTNEKFT